ncbi:hypothetical protein [Larkinella rosea]|uniref:D-alanine--D-alanine ligase n=1 Tax=Larkinella rosea TaxID=2025312 RepID=A0A3P1BTX7_9BACT|nr:hypothetical protein [Larkinella rosea]RRB03984.1 hypothetical protein EHT25_10665 [Larkinella rosea]
MLTDLTKFPEITSVAKPGRPNGVRDWLDRFLIRLRHWEYWPFALVYFPVVVYYVWLAMKSRSWFFFSASNPGIESGGMVGESKIDILNRIESQYKPKTLFFRQPTSNGILNQMLLLDCWFPIVAKPDRGERGWRVEKIRSVDELDAYLSDYPVDLALIVQEYIDEPLELGVFYYRMPGASTGTVSSIVIKEFLSVVGDGMSTIWDLLDGNDRARLQQSALMKRYGNRLQQILEPGEIQILEPIGNHCRGTKFLDGNYLITPELSAVFDRISLPIDGFFYGRYDIRCRSINDLYQGKHIRIMELNGAGAEPAHIYQPGFSLWAGWRVLLQHWRVLYDISCANHRCGVPYMTLKEARTIYQRIQRDKSKNRL